MASLPEFGWNPKTRTFWIVALGFPRLHFLAGADLDGKTIDLSKWKESGSVGRRRRFICNTAEGTWTLRVRPTGDVSGIEISLEGDLRIAPRTARLDPLLMARLPADHLVTHGRKMGGCGLYILKEEPPRRFESHFLLAATRDGMTLGISHPMAQDDVSRFEGRIAGGEIRNLAASTLFERSRRRRLRSAPVHISTSPSGHQWMTDWAVSQDSVREPVETPQESGWNSWDYYRWTITEEEVLRNAEFIASDPVLSRHIKRIIVDDGWAYCWGEWEANPLFPSGMRKLSRTLGRMGFTPGLWFAPTITEPHARISQLHPEFLAEGASGFPCMAFSCMGRESFVLDPTHPGVRTWWEEVFRRYASYGYRYFKLDFLSATVPSRRFADPSAKPGDLMRRIVEPIRRAVGSDSRILGCNYNFEPSLGLVNDVRVSSDIHSRWLSVKENVASIAVRFWAHRRFWINDPDFALCRGNETSADPDLHRLKALLPGVRPEDTNPSGFDWMHSLVELSRGEAEVLLSLVIVSGGAMNLSDCLPRLNAKGLLLLRKAVSAEKGNAAIPIDLFWSRYPSTWVQKLDSGLHRVLLVNWKDHRARLDVDLCELNVPRRKIRNFWADELASVEGGSLFADLAPHSCLLVECAS